MDTTIPVPTPFAALAGEGEETWFLQNRMTVKATAETTGGAYGLVESWIPAGASPPLQDRFGFSQAWRVDGGESVVFLAGQGPASAEGELVGAGDFAAQVRQTLENVRTVLEQAGASMESVVKLTVYLTDIGLLREYGRIRDELIPGPPPASTAVQVGALAWPGMMIEIDAVAVL